MQLGFALVPQENKYYWQETFNAIFHYLREHRMIMSDKAKGLDSIRELISHVARAMPIGEIHKHQMHSVVYALCIIHCSKNAGIQKSNIRALCVQWAKCGVESDQARKILQMKTAGITESQLTYMEQNAKHVTYVDLNRDQHLATNFEVVSNNMCEGNNARIKNNGQRSMAPVDHILSFLKAIYNSTCERFIIPEYSARGCMS